MLLSPGTSTLPSKQTLVQCLIPLDPLSPHDALKHHFTSTKIDLISWNLVVWVRKFSWKCFKNNSIFFICHPLQVIFIHYKSRIAAAIRGLYWMKITMVNSGLKGLKSAEIFVYKPRRLYELFGINLRGQRVFFLFEIIIIVLVSYFRFIWIHMFRSTVIINILILTVRDHLYTSESDVYRRQILTYKDGSWPERVNVWPASPTMGQYDSSIGLTYLV